MDKKVEFALASVGKSVIPKMYRRVFVEGNANYPRVESPIGAKCSHVSTDECSEPPQSEIDKYRERIYKAFIVPKELL